MQLKKIRLIPFKLATPLFSRHGIIKASFILLMA